MIAPSLNDIADRLGLARREVSRLLDDSEACYAKAAELLTQQPETPEAAAARDSEVEALMQAQNLRNEAIDAAIDRRDTLQAAYNELTQPRPIGRG